MFSKTERLAVLVVMIFLALIAMLVYACFFNLIVQPQLFAGIYLTVPTGSTIVNKFIFAGLEEIFFRVVPITSMYRLTVNRPKEGLWFVIFLFSAIFGYIHGGILNIFIQGVLGFVLAVEYLFVLAVWNGNWKAAFIGATTTHAVYNIILYTLGIP